METFDFVSLVLAAAPASGIPGRTVLQKVAYFCSVYVEQDHGFHAHFFGPYSEPVSDAVSSLMAYGFLRESRQIVNGGNARYDYELTQDGRKWARRLRSMPEAGRVEQLVKTVTSQPGWHKIDTISCAAKVHYILSQNGKPMTYAALREAAKTYGWAIGDSTIEEVAGFLQAIGFAKKP